MSNSQIFSASVYQQRREILRQKFDTGLVLLLGNEESSMNFSANWYRFRQDSTFLYYAGIDQPDLALLLDIDEASETVYGDDLTMDDIVWTGPQPTVAELGQSVGIDHSAPMAQLTDVLKKAAEQGRPIHFLPPYRPENSQKLHQWLGIPLAQISDKASIPLIKTVVEQRSIKSAEEVAEMEKAVTISNQMHRAAMVAAQPGMKEFELVGKVRAEAIAGGGDIAYPIILTVNGQTLHNHYYGNTLQEGDMVLVDAGAETASHYAGDLTRTFPVSKKFTSAQQEAYQVVLNAYHAAVDALKPGARFLDIHLLASEKLTEGLIEMGLMQGDPKEAVAQGAHAQFFQCGLGHMIGMDVHDMEDLGEQYVGYSDNLKKSTEFGLKSLRLGKALEAGHTLTVEPGLYFIPELMDMWKSEKKHADFIRYDRLDAFRNFGGIRVENNFLITEEGNKKLGEYLPLELDEIEALR
uniref:Xaa-Pro aminopeptidase n=1 Tax=Roseihalotalea indica TaxID=2867963 RepID=A0AA49GLQ5_9BACT|nr:aminopeptidase P family protein [Tunicatimonas sp. TK19036]